MLNFMELLFSHDASNVPLFAPRQPSCSLASKTSLTCNVVVKKQ
jgi:hypothetical protein